MPDLFNGLFGNTQQQNIQSQQNAQQSAQQYQMQMLQQMMQQQQQNKSQAMNALQGFMQQNPNPVASWGSIVGPNNAGAPTTIGGGTLGANGMPTGGGLPGTGGMMGPLGDPNLFRIIAQMLGQQTHAPAPVSLAPPASQSPQLPPGDGGMPHPRIPLPIGRRAPIMESM